MLCSDTAVSKQLLLELKNTASSPTTTMAMLLKKPTKTLSTGLEIGSVVPRARLTTFKPKSEENPSSSPSVDNSVVLKLFKKLGGDASHDDSLAPTKYSRQARRVRGTDADSLKDDSSQVIELPQLNKIQKVEQFLQSFIQDEGLTENSEPSSQQ
ncbi:hypothetical protein B566_EDAN002652 [Ephemera danica]|nr:hypothetical protein B566_EDAN002652 [Ephemera danica]